MPAGITDTDNMAYAGRRPWHGLGTSVAGAMTAQEAISAASMDWTVDTEPVYRYEDGRYTQVQQSRITVRSDTDTVLGAVGPRYTPVQNTECFNFFDAVTGTKAAKYHTVGSLWGGKKIWLLAQFEGEWEMDNGEQLDSFILLDNSHDGSSALRMRMTPVEVVCANTLAVATSQEAAFAARHTAGISTRISEARDLLGLNQMYMSNFLAECNRIADQAFSTFQMEQLTRKLLRLDASKAIDEQFGVKAKSAETMIELFSTGVGRRGETRWDAYGAVTEWADFYRGGRAIDSVGATDEEAVNRRLESSWFGHSIHTRNQAWQILTLSETEMDKMLEPVPA